VEKLAKAFEVLDSGADMTRLIHLKRIEGQFKFKLNSLYSCWIEKYKLTNEVRLYFYCHVKKKRKTEVLNCLI